MICSNCKMEEITHLIGESHNNKISYYDIYKDGSIELVSDSDIDEVPIIDFRCPECGEILAHTQEEAEKLLNEE